MVFISLPLSLFCFRSKSSRPGPYAQASLRTVRDSLPSYGSWLSNLMFQILFQTTPSSLIFRLWNHSKPIASVPSLFLRFQSFQHYYGLIRPIPIKGDGSPVPSNRLFRTPAALMPPANRPTLSLRCLFCPGSYSSPRF